MPDLEPASRHSRARTVLVPHAPARAVRASAWIARPLRAPQVARSRRMAGVGMVVTLAGSAALWAGLLALL